MGRSGAAPRPGRRIVLEGRCPFSVVLAARGTILRLAWLRLAGLFREVAALFAAADATMGPQALEDHFGGGGNGSGVFAVGDAETADVLEDALDFGELLAAFRGRGQFGEFKFAA